MIKPDWRAMVLAGVLLAACGGEQPPNPARERYEADKRHCDSVSADETARKSCMTYRGWKDGKFRR
jgi:hypothetical protein